MSTVGTKIFCWIFLESSDRDKKGEMLQRNSVKDTSPVGLEKIKNSDFYLTGVLLNSIFYIMIEQMN